MRRRPFRLFAPAAFVAAAVLLGAQATPDLFRFSRPISASAGWARLAIPDDVLDACRPGLPDLRLFDAGNREVPWALEERIGGSPGRYTFRDVERAAGRETTALVDRGARPPAATTATLSIDGTDWLKPVTIESSDDRSSWKTFAKGSVFATRMGRSTTLRFPPNDRRWWRFRFDDRNGDPVTPRDLTAIAETGGEAPRAVPLVPLTPALSRGEREQTLTVTLPAANMGVSGLRIEGEGAIYARRIRVWERIFYRGEVFRRPIGEDAIVRAADGSGRDEVAICEPSGRLLELEVESMDGPPLRIARVFALARERAILFSAPADSVLRLAYGSTLVDAPRYDVERALSVSRPRETKSASLGPAPPPTAAREVTPESELSIDPRPSTAPRAGPLDPALWKWRQPIELPSTGTVAYLDLSGEVTRAEGAPRILDASNRQVPYIVERAAHRERRAVQARISQRETRTVVELPDLRAPADVEAIEISATGPAFFSRQAVVLEQVMDERGAAGTRTLGSASWEKRAEDEPVPLTISISRPASTAIRLEVENGDNAPVTIGSVAVWTSVPRIDFVFAPGDRLTLVTGASDVPAPRYDLELVASRVLAAPALPARLSRPRAPAVAPAPPASKWLWVPIAVAAILVGIVLARTLRKL